MLNGVTKVISDELCKAYITGGGRPIDDIESICTSILVDMCDSGELEEHSIAELILTINELLISGKVNYLGVISEIVEIQNTQKTK